MAKRLLANIEAAGEDHQFFSLLQNFAYFKHSILEYIMGGMDQEVFDEKEGQNLLKNNKDTSLEELLTIYSHYQFALPVAPIRYFLESLTSFGNKETQISPKTVRNIFKFIRLLNKVPSKLLIPPCSNSISTDLKKTPWMKGGFSVYFANIRFERLVRFDNSDNEFRSQPRWRFSGADFVFCICGW